MKGNINKLALGVIIATIPMLITVAMASAVGKTIQGNYAFTGSGACVFGILGLNDSLQPNGGAAGPWFTGAQTWSGVLTFNKDGTGSLTGIHRVVDLVYSSAIGSPPDAQSGNVSWDFTYIVDNGNITFTYVTGSYELDWTDGPNAQSKVYINITQPWDGVISSDGKIIAVFWGAPLILEITADKANTNKTGVEVICNSELHGFKIK